MEVAALRPAARADAETVGGAPRGADASRTVAAERRASAAEARAERAEARAAAAEASAADVSRDVGDRDAWTAALARVPGVSTPDQLAEAVIRLERDLTAAIGGGGESAAEAAAGATAAAERRRADDADAARAAAKSTEEEAIAALARAERKVNLLVREKESLDRIIKSYEDEDAAKGGGKDAGADAAAVSGATTASASGADPFLFGGGATPSASTPPRTPADARARRDGIFARDARANASPRLESEVAACTAAASSARSVAAEHARARRPAASAALASATTRAESAGREAEALRARVGAGEFNPGTTKVLHLRANPESLANESAAERELAVVRGECEALRETVAQFHAAQAAAAAANTAGAGAGERRRRERRGATPAEGRDAAGVRGGDARSVSVHARSRDRFRGDAGRAGVRGDAGPVGGGGRSSRWRGDASPTWRSANSGTWRCSEADLELPRGGVPHLRV